MPRDTRLAAIRLVEKGEALAKPVILSNLFAFGGNNARIVIGRPSRVCSAREHYLLHESPMVLLDKVLSVTEDCAVQAWWCPETACWRCFSMSVVRYLRGMPLSLSRKRSASGAAGTVHKVANRSGWHVAGR